MRLNGEVESTTCLEQATFSKRPRASDCLICLILAHKLGKLGYFAERKLPVGRDEGKSST